MLKTFLETINELEYYVFHHEESSSLSVDLAERPVRQLQLGSRYILVPGVANVYNAHDLIDAYCSFQDSREQPFIPFQGKRIHFNHFTPYSDHVLLWRVEQMFAIPYEEIMNNLSAPLRDFSR